jgi:hypothetical protein
MTAFALTEPEAGSDAAALTLKAEADGLPVRCRAQGPDLRPVRAGPLAVSSPVALNHPHV